MGQCVDYVHRFLITKIVAAMVKNCQNVAAVGDLSVAGNSCRPRGYKTFFILNSAEHEISTDHKKIKYRQIKKFLALSLSDAVFVVLINVKMPTIVGILKFMSRINFVLR